MTFDVGAGTNETTEVPVCPRHPDVVAYVRCQRCGRPCCPQCQRPAAVGVQCVDCVKEHAKAVPVQRTVLGARHYSGRPAVTMTIIGACVVMFLLQYAIPGWTQLFAFQPNAARSEPYRFLTGALLHSTGFIGHIVFNMMALWMTGPLLEKALGRARYITLCIACAIGGSVGFLLLAGHAEDLSSSWYTPVVGASGMVFGLFGALIPVLKRLGGNPRAIIGTLAINAFLGFMVPGIAWQAHLGGFLVGLAMGYAYAKVPRERQQIVAWLLPVTVFALLIAASVAKYVVVGQPTPLGV